MERSNDEKSSEMEKLTYTQSELSKQLHEAVFKGDIDTVKLFLEQGADLTINEDKSDSAPLFQAVLANNAEMVKLLLDYGADPSVLESSILHGVVNNHNNKNAFKIVQYLIEHGADINKTDGNNDCALRTAFLLDNVVMGVLLIFVIQLKALNRYVSPQNLDCLNEFKNSETDAATAACEAEVENLKKINISSNSSVSLYDILAKDLSEVKLWFLNEEVKTALANKDFSNEFPIFSSMLTQRIKLAIREAELHEKCNL